MPSTYFPDAVSPTDREIFFFDLNGFVILKNAVAPADIAAANTILDSMQHLGKNDWIGWVQGHDYGGKEGLNLQQIYEAGEPFEKLIDHPSWIEKVRTFVGGEGTFDYRSEERRVGKEWRARWAPY